jgi:Rrf2 family cysteine metabolism transcriptional repressor
MNISTRARYGLRAVLDMAVNYGDKPVTLSAIAARQQLSEGYLEQLMAPMKKAGIIDSTRGAQGGYYLSREPKAIKIGEVFRALEGPLALVACISEKEKGQCKHRDNCGSVFIWSEIQSAISDVLDRYTIADLMCKEYETDQTKESE